MVNIPANLQRVWDDVSKDGKIDKADVQKLIKEAAPSLGSTGKPTLESVDSEIDTKERAFLSNFTGIPEGASIDVKNGTAKGTFDFVDPNQVKFSFKPKSPTEETPTKRYSPEIVLGGGSDTSKAPQVTQKETPKENPVTTTPASQSDNAQPVAGPDPKDVSDLAELKKMKDTLDPQLKDRMADLDKQIASLEEKIAKATPKKEEPVTPANTDTVPVEPPKDDSDVSKDLQILTSYNALKANLSPDKLDFKDQTKMIDDKISAIKVKIAADFIKSAEKLTKPNAGNPKLSADEFKKAKSIVERDYNNLPAEIKAKPEIEAAFKAIPKDNLTSKESLFAEINSVINATVAEALKTGDMSKFTIAKNEINRLVSLNPELANDPQIQKIKSILSGETPPGENDNSVTKAITTIKTTEGLLNKPDWSKTDYAKAKDLVKDTDFIAGPFKSKLEGRVASYETVKRVEKEQDKEKSIGGIEDALGKGFLNATNKASLFGIMQSKASRGEIEELLTKLEPDDQIKAMRLLAQSKDNFNMAIARKLYDKVSSTSNVDKKLGKDVVDQIKKFVPENITENGKEPRPKELKDYQVNESSFVQGLKYSVYNEKDTALTMARSIIDGSVSANVLSQLSREDITALTDLVGKKGHKGEKDDLLQMISGNYAKGDSVDVSFMSKPDQIKVVKGILDNENIDETKLDELVNKVNKDTIFDLVNQNELTDKQLVILAKHCDGDTMANDPKVAEKMLMAMIKSYNKDQQSVSLSDINNFVDEIDKDMTKDKDIMKQVLENLTKGSDVEYAKFQSLSPDTLDKIRQIANS